LEKGKLMDFKEYPDQEMLAINVANVLAGALENALLKHDTVSFAVPGGSTPGAVFDALCGAHLDWGRVTVLLTDERWVPMDHPRSNSGLVAQRLLCDRAAAARFMGFYEDGRTAAQSAPDLAHDIADYLPLSVVLLGMGGDMHTASLFPGADGTKEAMAQDAPAVCAVHPKDDLEPRVTLSANAINGALSKHLVIFGHEKRAALEGALKLPAHEAPIAAVLRGATVHWAP
jgi:6-phosphogluconolactonase